MAAGLRDHAARCHVHFDLHGEFRSARRYLGDDAIEISDASSSPPESGPPSAASRWPAPLASRLPDDATATLIADAVGTVWQDIDRALHPVIGHLGVTALFNRCIKRTAASHPWMACSEPGMAVLDTAQLRAAVALQTPAEAGAGSIALFHSMHELLESLVGSSLTDRLLGPIWAHSPGAKPGRNSSP